MPRKKKVKKEMRGYNHSHLCHLFFGHNWFGPGFGGDRGHFSERTQAEMRSAWPILREQVFELARERSIRRKNAPKLPAAFWWFDSSEKRNPEETESQQLARLGLSAEVILFG